MPTKYAAGSKNNPEYWLNIKQRIEGLLSTENAQEKLQDFVLEMITKNGVPEIVDGGEDYNRFLARSHTRPPTTDWRVPGLKVLTSEAGGVRENLLAWALQLERKFPSGDLPIFSSGETGEIALSRSQVLVLLSHMVLCSLPVTGVRQNYCWSSLQPWLTRDSGPALAYLSCLAQLFSQHRPGHSAELDSQLITFTRLGCQTSDLPDWIESSAPLISLDTRCPSSIGRQLGQEVELDFANKDIGFGPGGTQEEILFGMTPEACPAVLLSPTLLDRESLLISGVERTGDWAGYGWDVKYLGPGDRQCRTILCLDALEVEPGASARQQAGGQQLWRELAKCLTGFRACQGRVLATGAWGCGAFGGDKDVKLAIQLAAASEAGLDRLRYHTSDSQLAAVISSTVEVWRDKHWTVGHLVRALLSYAAEEESQQRFFNYSTEIS